MRQIGRGVVLIGFTQQEILGSKCFFFMGRDELPSMPVQNRAKRYNDRFARVLLGVQKVKVSITQCSRGIVA